MNARDVDLWSAAAVSSGSGSGSRLLDNAAMTAAATGKPQHAGAAETIGNIAMTLQGGFADSIARGLVLVSGIVWADAIRSLFDKDTGVFKQLSNWGPWIVAAAVTAISVLMTVYLNKRAKKYQKQLEQ